MKCLLTCGVVAATVMTMVGLDVRNVALLICPFLALLGSVSFFFAEYVCAGGFWYGFDVKKFPEWGPKAGGVLLWVVAACV